MATLWNCVGRRRVAAAGGRSSHSGTATLAPTRPARVHGKVGHTGPGRATLPPSPDSPAGGGGGGLARLATRFVEPPRPISALYAVALEPDSARFSLLNSN